MPAGCSRSRQAPASRYSLPHIDGVFDVCATTSSGREIDAVARAILRASSMLLAPNVPPSERFGRGFLIIVGLRRSLNTG